MFDEIVLSWLGPISRLPKKKYEFRNDWDGRIIDPFMFTDDIIEPVEDMAFTWKINYRKAVVSQNVSIYIEVHDDYWVNQDKLDNDFIINPVIDALIGGGVIASVAQVSHSLLEIVPVKEEVEEPGLFVEIHFSLNGDLDQIQ